MNDHSRPIHRSLTTVALLLAVAGCTGTPAPYDERVVPPVLGEADGAGEVDVLGRIAPGSETTGRFESASQRFGYIFYASSDASFDLEVTHRGSSRGLDTILSVFGPRNAAGIYDTQIAADDASGYGELSKIAAAAPGQAGFYLAVVEMDGSAEDNSPKDYRLELRCGAGTCQTSEPVARAGNDVRWTQVSAEMKALSIQAYNVASAELEARSEAGELDGAWAVALDVDETVLSNLTYQRERGELGLGYSSPSWFRWVQRQEATPIAGALRFLAHVRELGGTIAFVTNRKASECPDTEANLAAYDVPYDLILCRTDSSDKNARWNSIENGTASPSLPAMPIVMWVGDNIQDFPMLGQEIRFEEEDAFADFAERFLLVPNPMYGSWERNAE